jgi:hypothetical protein
VRVAGRKARRLADKPPPPEGRFVTGRTQSLGSERKRGRRQRRRRNSRRPQSADGEVWLSWPVPRRWFTLASVTHAAGPGRPTTTTSIAARAGQTIGRQLILPAGPFLRPLKPYRLSTRPQYSLCTVYVQSMYRYACSVIKMQTAVQGESVWKDCRVL